MSGHTSPGESEARAKACYEFGFTPLRACRRDPRLSYCLYVPPGIHDPGVKPELIVSMHGTARNTADFRDHFAEFAQWNRCVVLTPLFPAGVAGDDDRDGYKYILDAGIRYDDVLLSMVEEIEEQYGLSFPRFALWGFSGGGHFTHRFLLLHPERLWAASVGGPGSVTLLDDRRDWWVGTRNVKDLFGRDLNIDAMTRVAIHMVVGAADRETWEITHYPGSRRFMEGANDAGETRPDRLDRLRRNFEAAGLAVSLDIVPGVSHDEDRVVHTTKTFFARALASMRSSEAQTR